MINLPLLGYTGPKTVRLRYKELESLENGSPLGNANLISQLVLHIEKMNLSNWNYSSFYPLLLNCLAKTQIQYNANRDKLRQRKTDIGSELGPNESETLGGSLDLFSPVQIIIKKDLHFKINLSLAGFFKSAGFFAFKESIMTSQSKINDIKKQLQRTREVYLISTSPAERQTLARNIRNLKKQLGRGNG